jgi:hypothetical protein
VEGAFHDITGLALFVVAFVMMVAFDGLVGVAIGIGRRLRRRPGTRLTASPT